MKNAKRLYFAARAFLLLMMLCASSEGTPANKAALGKHYDRFLTASLNRCSTCHLPSEKKNPETLEEFPHNPFGERLRVLGEALGSGAVTIPKRLAEIAAEDSDGDGIENEAELLLGHNPGDGADRPENLAQLAPVRSEFEKFVASYRWKPFETVKRPELPALEDGGWGRNSIDRFIAAEHEKRGLEARPEAPREVLMRRVYMDLIGLNPTEAEQKAFLEDTAPDAYERLVNRLLEDYRYGERWGRHWMDVWRYSDWAGWSGGNQIRDSQPHIWRWKEWIIESLNAGKPYDRMVMEMLAADELAPEDTDALRATGYLVRNYKMLSREQWLEDTIKHTSQAFMGVTIGCAKCHDHMYDPISQAEYYQMRAVFEPHHVRTDRVPGELDRTKTGLPRAYDQALEKPTYFFIRGDERKPDTNRVMQPGLPRSLCWEEGQQLEIQSVRLPGAAAEPDKRPFVIEELLAKSERALRKAGEELERAGTIENRFRAVLAEARHEALVAELEAEKVLDAGEKDSAVWRELALQALTLQRKAVVVEGKLKVHEAGQALKAAEVKAGEAGVKEAKEVAEARKKLDEARAALASAQKELDATPTTEFKPRERASYPARSTGRRLAFARWLTDSKHPLAARVAVNHIWLRHFGRGIVPNPADFGANAAGPTHPQLLDWLAAEFMERGWKMKELHRLILTSSTYRMASTGDEGNAAIDPDNHYLWRMNSRRIDAELVRDNLLHVAGNMDYRVGGPDIPHTEGLTSKRRSVYLRIAAEKEVEFLRIFDGPAVTECYQRHTTVMPQQALALANSGLALSQARVLAEALSGAETPEEFVAAAYRRTLARAPKAEELRACVEFLATRKFDARSRENLALVLFNHNDFVTVR